MFARLLVAVAILAVAGISYGQKVDPKGELEAQPVLSSEIRAKLALAGKLQALPFRISGVTMWVAGDAEKEKIRERIKLEGGNKPSDFRENFTPIATPTGETAEKVTLLRSALKRDAEKRGFQVSEDGECPCVNIKVDYSLQTVSTEGGLFSSKKPILQIRVVANVFYDNMEILRPRAKWAVEIDPPEFWDKNKWLMSLYAAKLAMDEVFYAWEKTFGPPPDPANR